MYDGAKDAYSYEWSRQNPFFRGALCTITLSYKGIKNNASPVYCAEGQYLPPHPDKKKNKPAGK